MASHRSGLARASCPAALSLPGAGHVSSARHGSSAVWSAAGAGSSLRHGQQRHAWPLLQRRLTWTQGLLSTAGHAIQLRLLRRNQRCGREACALMRPCMARHGSRHADAGPQDGSGLPAASRAHDRAAVLRPARRHRSRSAHAVGAVTSRRRFAARSACAEASCCAILAGCAIEAAPPPAPLRQPWRRAKHGVERLRLRGCLPGPLPVGLCACGHARHLVLRPGTSRWSATPRRSGNGGGRPRRTEFSNVSASAEVAHVGLSLLQHGALGPAPDAPR